MTSRTLLFIDRLVALILGIVLVAGGAALIWWKLGDTYSNIATVFSDRTDTSRVSDLVDQEWWPYASAAAGLVLTILGLRWIFAHLSNRRVTKIALRGSGSSGQLTLNLHNATATAAEVFADTIGVRNARGTSSTDRGQLVARINAVIEPEADLALIARRADDLATELAHVVGRNDMRCTIQLKVASRGHNMSRVD